MTKLLDKIAAFQAKKGPVAEESQVRPPRILKFGTVTVSNERVEIRDFTTENTPNEGELPKLVIDWAIDRLAEGRKLIGPRPQGISKYVDAIRRSVASKNWFAALFLALAMPDICGALEDPDARTGERYKKWFARYVGAHYPPDLFSEDDCYYLRCAALHQGLARHPRAQNKRIHFITPPPPWLVVHSCFVENPDGSFVLQMQIDIFCQEMCDGVERWLRDVSTDQAIMTRIDQLLEFYDPSQPING